MAREDRSAFEVADQPRIDAREHGADLGRKGLELLDLGDLAERVGEPHYPNQVGEKTAFFVGEMAAVDEAHEILLVVLHGRPHVLLAITAM